MKILLLALLAPLPALAASHPPTRATGGMVTADNALASEAGARILATGGDAADAAVTTALVLGVVQPFASGLGGGGFALVHRAAGDGAPTAYTLDFRETAPAGAHKDLYLDASGDVIPGASTRGPRAAGVPGELAGLYALHQKHGKLPWKQVVLPALKLARDGFPAGALLADRIARHQAAIAKVPALARIFLRPDGAPRAEGELIVRPDLARTLALVSRKGAPAFYTGPFAWKMAAAITKDGGLINAADLKGYAIVEREALSADYRGYRVLAAPPPSSGGAVLIQVLRALEASRLDALGHNSSAYLHRLTEALKHAFADRAAVMGDPAFHAVPTAELIGDATVQRVRASFRPDRTHARDAYGGPYGAPADHGTSHFNVIDAAGNAVALTTTINTTWGSMYVAGDTGVVLNNEMDDFVARPGVPNAFGLIGREADGIAPGKRPLSSMSPTIVLKDGKFVAAAGASGGPTIITGTLQALLNVLDFGMSARAAVEAPRVHHQWVPETLFVEPEVPADVIDALRRRGHAVEIRRRFNSVQLIVAGEGGIDGACDPSKQGAPAGVPRAP